MDGRRSAAIVASPTRYLIVTEERGIERTRFLWTIPYLDDLCNITNPAAGGVALAS